MLPCFSTMCQQQCKGKARASHNRKPCCCIQAMEGHSSACLRISSCSFTPTVTAVISQ
jgi:hypothetical protein